MNTLKGYRLLRCRVCGDPFFYWYNGNICKPCHQAGQETPADVRWRETLERLTNEVEQPRKGRKK